MEGFYALYIFMLAAFTGYEVISRVPVILHTPLMSGSNFIHGVVLVGAMVVLGHADPGSTRQLTIGFFAVFLGAANAAGGYVVTERMLGMFNKGKIESEKPATSFSFFTSRRNQIATAVVVAATAILAVLVPKQTLVNLIYFVVAVVFILGLKAMSSPVTARRGIMAAGVAMAVATVITFLPDMHNVGLMIIAIIAGGSIAWWSGKVVKMTDMPQMVAIYNGMGGGAAAAIAALEFARGSIDSATVSTLAALGALIGSVAFSGSCIAFAKLQGIMKKTWSLPNQNIVNSVLALIAVLLGVLIVASETPSAALIVSFFIVSLALGVILTSPIGGADMPVVISLLNAFTGLAVGFEGFVLGNPALIVAGIVVGASGTLLTQLMAKAMNRPILNVIFTPITGEAQAGGQAIEGSLKEYSATDAASVMRYASKVIIVPGYGMAVAGAQHKVWEMAQLLENEGVDVSFAIHPVAGRMPGHMNVLLAEAGVPYDKIFDLEEINAEFDQADVALVIGANDVVNPAARTDKSSPIYGMPILNADHAKDVIVIKRGKGVGYSGIENALFYMDNCHMLYGSAQQAIADVIAQIKLLEG